MADEQIAAPTLLPRSHQLDQAESVLTPMLDVKSEGLIGSALVPSPCKNLPDVDNVTQSILVAVEHHQLLRDARWGRRLMPEVHPVDRLIDLPLDVTGIDASMITAQHKCRRGHRLIGATRRIAAWPAPSSRNPFPNPRRQA